jgi:putative thioredoxin
MGEGRLHASPCFALLSSLARTLTIADSLSPENRMSASLHVFDATEATFEAEVIHASFQQPVLVDFWAAWCGPCRSLGPILEKLADEFAGAFRLAKVDTDAQMQLAAVFGIRSLPTVVLLKQGQMVDGFMGALPEGAIREFLTKHGIVAGAAPDAVDLADEEVIELALTPEDQIAQLQQASADEHTEVLAVMESLKGQVVDTVSDEDADEVSQAFDAAISGVANIFTPEARAARKR